jgi:hypothetical protein
MKQMLNCMKRQLDTGRADRLALLVGGFEKMTLRDGPLSAFYFDGSKDCVRTAAILFHTFANFADERQHVHFSLSIDRH